MDAVNLNLIRENLKAFLELAVSNHAPTKETRWSGEAFEVMSTDDWERDQKARHAVKSR